MIQNCANGLQGRKAKISQRGKENPASVVISAFNRYHYFFYLPLTFNFEHKT